MWTTVSKKTRMKRHKIMTYLAKYIYIIEKVSNLGSSEVFRNGD
jgi:hypothetical protein